MALFKRRIIDKIIKYLDSPDILVIHGARQVGKTSLLRLIMQNLSENQYFYFDLEDSRFFALCEQGMDAVLLYLKQKGVYKDQNKFYIFIDEIQYLSNPSNFLKLTHDHYPQIKLIVSGSSSFDIKRKFKDSLVGRTVNFELFPLDFKEVLIFRGKTYNFNEDITDKRLQEELKNLYKEYILYGGYPKIILTDSLEMKEKYLQQIIDTYIKKDIRDLANLRDVSKFNKLLQVLASQSGNLLNITELSNTAGIAKQTVEDYLFILENTYVIKLVSPFYNNIRSELFKTPKIFFYDTGLLSLLWLKMLPREVIGNIFETAFFSELIKNIRSDFIFYWRTQDKKEIDFIIKNENFIPIEVKYNANTLVFTALNYFCHNYNLKKAFCVCLEGDINKDGIKKIYPWDFLKEIL